jgi:hypothetical protein
MIFESERRMGLYLLGALCLTLGAVFVGMRRSRSGERAREPRGPAPPLATAPEPLVNEALVEAQGA